MVVLCVLLQNYLAPLEKAPMRFYIFLGWHSAAAAAVAACECWRECVRVLLGICG
jgi:hypothetical protein